MTIEQIDDLLNGCISRNKHALARVISLLERSGSNADEHREYIEQFLHNVQGNHADCLILGWTGTPGAGKSTLLGKIGMQILEQSKLSMAILAVDPSSHISGGAILGDRTRTRFPLGEDRIFFRSQASSLEMGGLAPRTWDVVNFLRYFFDIIFIETVGIGQNEIEIRHACDHTALIVQPFSGDQIQFIKSGIMEIPDFFVINKCDEEKLARQSYSQLHVSLDFVKGVENRAELPPIFMTSALHEFGIRELCDQIFEYQQKNQNQTIEKFKIRNSFFIQRAIARDFGSFGIQYLAKNNFQFATNKYAATLNAAGRKLKEFWLKSTS